MQVPITNEKSIISESPEGRRPLKTHIFKGFRLESDGRMSEPDSSGQKNLSGERTDEKRAPNSSKQADVDAAASPFLLPI